MNTTLTPYLLFGSTKPWLPPPWTTTDDRVRGGASQSHLSALPNNSARFHGHLDISTLGGAGFASQFSGPLPGDAKGRTEEFGDGESAGEGEEEDSSWDLSAYDGVEVLVGGEEGGGGGKVWTLILKDEEGAGKRGDGRERAGVNWEVDFRVGGGQCGGVEGRGKTDGGGGEGSTVWVPWGAFKATYRGKEMEDAGELKTGEVRRIGFMMRSYFGKQEGDFSLVLKSVCARKKSKQEDEGGKVVKAVGSLSGSIPESTDLVNSRPGTSRGAGWLDWFSGWR